MSIDPVAISRSALDVEWQRLQVISMNLANENTTGVGGRGGYRPMMGRKPDLPKLWPKGAGCRHRRGCA
jgi:hypothetical protein